MTSATELWAAVVVSYEASGLVALTNIRDPGTSTITTATGENAAQGVIDMWPIYAEETYDSTNSIHVEVGKFGVIAILWRRGGSSTEIAKVEWDEVFSSEGMIARVRRTGPRGRKGPSSNSGVRQRTEATASGGRYRGWSDIESLPVNYLPRRVTASDT